MFAPTHTVPAGGLPAWAAPDPSAAPVTTLEAQLPIEVAETAGDWARVVCSNGWTGWVDGRRLPAPATAPAPAAPAPAPAPAASPSNQTAVFDAPNAGWAAASAAPAAAATTSWEQPAPSEPASSGSRGSIIPFGRILVGFGGFLVIVSLWIEWISGSFTGLSAYKVPANFLLDNNTGDAGLSLGLLVLGITIIALVISFLPFTNPGALVFGLIIGFIVVVFLVQLQTGVSDNGGDLGDVLGIGSFVAGFGALLMFGGGIVDLFMRSAAKKHKAAAPVAEASQW